MSDEDDETFASELNRDDMLRKDINMNDEPNFAYSQRPGFPFETVRYVPDTVVAELVEALEDANGILADVFNPAIRTSPARMASVTRRIEKHFDRRAALLHTTSKTHEEQTNWISVKDRLPEKMPNSFLSPLVLIYPYYERTSSFYDYNAETWFCNHAVTHWMPLPEPPKGILTDEHE